MKIKLILTTTNSYSSAQEIAEYLLKLKLSPCVQIIPNIESIYKWEGKVQYSKEFLLIIKTIPKYVKKCKKHILDMHNYDIPEMIVTEGEIILDAYRDWFLMNMVNK